MYKVAGYCFLCIREDDDETDVDDGSNGGRGVPAEVKASRSLVVTKTCVEDFLIGDDQQFYLWIHTPHALPPHNCCIG